MMVFAAAETHTLWAVALGVGAVVVAVVVVLMALLLTHLRETSESVGRLLEVGAEVGTNTAAIRQLADTGPVLEMIKAEALVHDGYLQSQLR